MPLHYKLSFKPLVYSTTPHMLFSWFELLLLVAVIQGVITSFLLLKESYLSVPYKFLGLAILGFDGICIKMVIYSIGLESIYPWLAHIPLAFETAIPPLVYLYFASLTQTHDKFNRIRKAHFIPFGIFMLYAVFIYVNVLLAESHHAQVTLLDFYHLSAVKAFEDYFTVVSILVYLALGREKLKQFRLQADNYTSDNNHIVFLWLKKIQVLMLVLIIFLIVNMIIDRTAFSTISTNIHWKIYFLYLAGVTYYLGFIAIKSPILLTQVTIDEPIKSDTKRPVQDSKMQALTDKIEDVIDTQKLYLNPTFSIQDLSACVQVNQSTVSQVINRYMGISFRELINQKRIEMAKSLLVLNKDKNVSILSQALECGFNSEASFYRVFKKHTGKSPKQYIDAQ